MEEVSICDSCNYCNNKDDEKPCCFCMQFVDGFLEATQYKNKEYYIKGEIKTKEIKTKEIKNCPFCGGEGELHNEGDWGSMWVECLSCEAEGAWVDSHDGFTEDDAIDKWNMRV